MDTSRLYDDDIVTWAEQQAEGMRLLAAKPELSNIVDWVNITEEIESLGRSEWRAVESLLTQAFTYIQKRYCDPDSLSRLAWEIETNTFLIDARANYQPSMRANLDIDGIWQRAFEYAAQELLTYRRRVPPGIPAQSPFSLGDMLDETSTHEHAVRQLQARLDQTT
jgi:hypothetical protein